MVRSRAVALVAATLALAVAGVGEVRAGSAATPSAADNRLPTIHPDLAAAVTALAPGDRLEVVVSAHTFDGLAVLDELGAGGTRLRSVPIALVRLTRADLSRLAGDPAIRSLWPRESFDLFLDDSTQIVGADRVEQLLGVDGDGVAVAVLDTGIDATHPHLPWHNKVVANFEVVANPFDPDGDLLVDMPDTDDDGHGTHVASTIAGNDADGVHLHDGVAPGADLYGYSVNVSLTIDLARSLVAFDDVIQRRLAGDPIVAISNSWGGGPGEHNPDDPLSIIVKAAFDADIAVVFAAGNSGQEAGELDTASDQCTMPWVVCVGATTDPGQLVQFSSRGRPPVPTHVVMPDGLEYDVPAGNHDRNLGQALDIGVFRPTVSAPGVNVVAACARSACGVPGDYQSLSGTSMATPHVSGVVALLHAARGSLDLRADDVIDVLESTATPMPGWQLWEAGTGLVNAYDAARAVRSDLAHLAPANVGAIPRPLGEPTSQSVDGVAGPGGQQTGALVRVHEVEVSEGTDRLDLLLEWDLPVENLYLFAWRPGTDPADIDADRADQESWGLLEGLGPRLNTFRIGTIPSPEPGTWHVEVRGRVNTLTPYTLTATTRPAARPSVTVESVDERGFVVELAGTATFDEAADDGVTRASVAGSQLPLSNPGTPTPYWFRGEVPEAEKLLEEPAFGIGPRIEPTAPSDPIPSFQTGGWYGNDAFAANFLLAYWRAPFDQTLRGDVPVQVWLSAPTMSLGGVVTVTLFDAPTGTFGDDDARVIGSTTVSGAGVGPTPTLVEATLPNVLHTFGPERDLIVQLSTTFIDVGYFTAWYDSTEFPSGISLPIAQASSAPSRPTGLTATSRRDGGVALVWDDVDDATGYRVHRSDTPTALGAAVATVTEPAFAETGLADVEAVYYRVVAIGPGGESDPSDGVVGTPVGTRRSIAVRAGRGPWETFTALGSGPWEATVPLAAGLAADPSFTVRAQDQSGASPEASA